MAYNGFVVVLDDSKLRNYVRNCVRAFVWENEEKEEEKKNILFTNENAYIIGGISTFVGIRIFQCLFILSRM